MKQHNMMKFYLTPSIYRTLPTSEKCYICPTNLSKLKNGLAIQIGTEPRYVWVCSDICAEIYITKSIYRF
jgi:hypothetical protein